MRFADKITLARKEKGLSRSELGKLIDTSSAIIGRYERGEMTPSIEVAAKLSKALDVSLDYLAGNASNALKDQRMISRLDSISAMSVDEQRQLLNVIDALIFKAKFEGHAA